MRPLTARTLGVIAASLLLALAGCGANDTYSPTVAGAVAAGTFTIGASPGTDVVFQGESATYTVTVTAVNGFSSPVTLSASNLPVGATASFNTNPVTPTAAGANSTLTISTTGTGSLSGTIKSVLRSGSTSRAITPTGSYRITITGTGGGITQSTTVDLTVDVPG